MNLNHIYGAVAIVALAVGVSNWYADQQPAAPVPETPFSESKKTEIGSVVSAYISANPEIVKDTPSNDPFDAGRRKEIAEIAREFIAANPGLVKSDQNEAVFNDAKKKEIAEIAREYLVANPEILVEMSQELQRREEVQKLAQAKEALSRNKDIMFRSDNTFVAGNPNGDITLVEFFDYNCHYCKVSLDNVLEFIKSDSNVRVVMREFPILSEGSVIAAMAALASRKQNKYWEFHLALMRARGLEGEAQVMQVAKSVGLDVEQLKRDMKDPSVSAAIQEGRQLAEAVGINATPSFVLDDQIINNSAQLVDILNRKVVEIRQSGGCKVC